MTYFSYGSNMLAQRMKERVPGARLLGAACLRGHRLAWHKVNVDGSGKCDVVPDGGSDVWGVLYEIDPEGKMALDGFEGLGRGYAEKAVTVEHGDRLVDAFTYYATHTRGDLLPYGWYRDIVLLGARQNGLPADYVDSIGMMEVLTDPDDSRRSEYLRFLRD
jgi:gamma-glutamylcyclotransferase